MSRNKRRRQRQKERRNSQSDNPPNALQSDILEDPETQAADLSLIRRNVRWAGMTDAAKAEIVDRLRGVVRKTETVSVNKDGEPVATQDVADANAILASKVLISLESQIQKDEHLEKKLARPAGRGLSVGVNVGLNQVQMMHASQRRERLTRMMQNVERRQKGEPEIPQSAEDIEADEAQQTQNLMSLCEREGLTWDPADAVLMDSLRAMRKREVDERLSEISQRCGWDSK